MNCVVTSEFVAVQLHSFITEGKPSNLYLRVSAAPIARRQGDENPIINSEYELAYIAYGASRGRLGQTDKRAHRMRCNG